MFVCRGRKRCRVDLLVSDRRVERRGRLGEVRPQRGIGPGFLVHDSHLFDGVDERQIGRGLALADEIATLYGFKYIVTMNSDDLPSPCQKDLSSMTTSSMYGSRTPSTTAGSSDSGSESPAARQSSARRWLVSPFRRRRDIPSFRRNRSM